jgi:acetylornithine deacetylase/succinyl-diaminopimelate desuccinylase-like protein
MAHDEALGQATVAPTLYTIDQRSPNVIPAEVRLLLDWRNVPTESPADIIAKAQGWLEASLAGLEAGQVSQPTVEITTRELTTYTGMVKMFPSIFPSYLLPEDNVFIQTAQETLIEVLERDEGVDIWRFATDGGHLMAAGIPTIGFGPGDEQLAHTNQERISLAQMNEAVVAYTALILALAEAAERNT